MATLLTISGLLDWDDTVLSGINGCINNTIFNLYYDGYKMSVRTYDEDDRVKNKIVYECGMLECIYQNPETLKNAVSQWVSANSYRWTKLYLTTLYKYDALYNYDRTEEYEDTDTEIEKHTGSGNSNGNSNSERKVGAYNNEMQKAEENLSGGNSQFSQNGNRDATKTKKHRARMYGNIGVTTTQEMIESERRVSSFDIADIIANEFRQQFCISVY